MVVELPLITAEDITAEFRPGGEATVKATLRRLREKELVSQGLTERPRGSGGRIAGALHVYSALNLDAARAARSNDFEVARQLAKAAARIEHHGRTAEVVRRLAELGGSTPLRRRFERVSSFDETLRAALRAVVAETAAERNRLAHGYALSPPRLAFVAKLYGDVAELNFEGTEEPVSLPIQDLDALGSAFVGAALSLRFEPFGRGQTLLKAAPAIQLDEDVGDQGDDRLYPYERPLPEPASAVSLAGALAASPTIRRPRSIEVADSR